MNRKDKILFFDVDTQKDFIQPDGNLYVNGAEQLIDKFKKLIKHARDKGIALWGSVDAHHPEDEELNRNEGPFPDHCMVGQTGQEKIEATQPINPLWVENRPHTPEEIGKIMLHQGEVYFEKQSYDVFENPAIKECINKFEIIVIFGVTSDYCIKAAAEGFLDHNKNVFIVADAIKPVDPEVGKKARELLHKKGAQFTTTERIINGTYL